MKCLSDNFGLLVRTENTVNTFIYQTLHITVAPWVVVCSGPLNDWFSTLKYAI